MVKLIVTAALILMGQSSSSSAGVWPKRQAKLVVFMVIDQFRADYLARYQSKFRKDGFLALMKNGSYFPFGEYDVLQSMTGPGHATVLTGSYPYQAGIPLNDWYDQNTRQSVYCVEDLKVETVGAPTKLHVGTSPRNLVATTVGDEMKNEGGAGRVVTVALKDRAAILMGGHRADLAMWWDADAAKWVSSRYYVKDGKLPSWIEVLNERSARGKCDLSTICGTERTVEAFRAMFKNYKLGQGKSTDFIAVSFSSHDYAGHKHGANSAEIEAMTLSEDKAVSDIREIVQKSVSGGLKDVIFVLTADHGVAPSPDYLKDTGIESGNISEAGLKAELEARLTEKFGEPTGGPWIGSARDFNFYLNEDVVAKANLDIKILESEMKQNLLTKPYFAQVFTRADYENRALPPGQFERQINKTYYRGRSGHVIAIQKPFYINEPKGHSDHMTGYVYDRTVPILFSGLGINNGVFTEKAEVVDIAPTLAFLMGILPPALSEGHVLSKVIK